MSYFYNQKGQEAAKLKIQTSACMELVCSRWGPQWKKKEDEQITGEFGEYGEGEYCVKISCRRLSLKQLPELKSQIKSAY